MWLDMKHKVFALVTALLVLALAVVSILRQQGDERNGTECVASESFEVPTTKEHDPTLRPSPRSARVEASPRPTRKPSAVATHPQAVPTDAKGMLRSKTGQNPASAPRSFDVVRLAAEKSQLMDDLLNEEQIPSDYGTVMVSLFRDRSQDVYTRDFVVQHIGLYAEALHCRGSYDAELCGERGIASSIAMLRRLAGDPQENAVVRKSAARAVRALEGR